MITFLFWNIQGKPLQQRVARLVTRYGVDVLILAECVPLPNEILIALRARTVAHWVYPPASSERLRVFTRLPAASVVDLFTEVFDRMTIREIRPPGAPAFLLAGVHLPSKFGWKDPDHTSWIHFITEDLQRIEGRGTGRLVLVGDLNMDPFDAGVVGGFGLHALSTKDLAIRRSERVAQGRLCNRTFFNPMWRFLADRGRGPSGTYYRRESVPVNHYWHALDQVLVRPELADKVVNVEILDHDGTEPLTHPDGGWPDPDQASDHLPLLFTINP
jgi:hypothetical protein